MTDPLMGDPACRPVADKGAYAVYLKADVEALRAQSRERNRRLREVVHENALLCAKLDRYEHAARCRRDSDNEYFNEC